VPGYSYRRLTSALTLTALLCAARLDAATPVVADPISEVSARAVVQRTIELVEAQGLYPRKHEEYAAAKASLLGALEDAGDPVDRQALFRHVTALLQTLDADGHSAIWAPSRERQIHQAVAARRAQVQTSSFALLATAHGQVLHWTPPQSVGDIKVEAPLFLKRFNADHAATPEADQACALVVDLSAQLGGNAWPPFIAMHPLLSSVNPAAFVDREGARTAFVNPKQLREMEAAYGGLPDNPLRRFADAPLAVVVGSKTVSAGEMLLVALMGEGARTRTFGHTSAGATTANVAYPLTDGSTLVLTRSRYAIGDAPVIRGGIAPQTPAQQGQTTADTVRQAAEWAALASPLCQQQRAT